MDGMEVEFGIPFEAIHTRNRDPRNVDFATSGTTPLAHGRDDCAILNRHMESQRHISKSNPRCTVPSPHRNLQSPCLGRVNPTLGPIFWSQRITKKHAELFSFLRDSGFLSLGS